MLERPQDGSAHVAVLDVINHADLGQICSIAMTGTHIRKIFVEGGRRSCRMPRSPPRCYAQQ
jgi:hypothetical protein